MVDNKTKKKIEATLKFNTKINELKLKRDLWDITPEVLEMCKQHVDQMLETTKKESKIDPKELEEAAEQIKNDQELLVHISQFADIYDEVLVWNNLIKQKKLSKTATSRHREMDIALYHGKIVKIQREKKYSARIHTLIYHYAHRNDKQKQFSE